jgi:hypothetical protein
MAGGVAQRSELYFLYLCRLVRSTHDLQADSYTCIQQVAWGGGGYVTVWAIDGEPIIGHC